MGVNLTNLLRIDPDSPVRIRSDKRGTIEDLYRDVPAIGLGAGYYPGVSEVHKFGRNTDVGTALETVWNEGGLLTYLTTATVLQISSDDADDTSAGAGAQTVEIQGLDENWVMINELVILNGQTQVPTVSKFIRVFRMRVMSAGASTWNEGIIYAGTGAPSSGKPAVVLCLIEDFMAQSMVAFNTIPVGHIGYIVHTNFTSSVTKDVFIGLFVREFGGVLQLKEPYTLTDNAGGIPHISADEYPEKTDFEVRAQVGVAGGSVTGQYELILVKNSP